jgi:hypothetical protein
MTPFEELKTQESRRKRILAEQNGACNHCELTDWRGKPIALELEHKDGDSQNNARENLECICPNCHSQTPTWRGRNKAARKKITDEEMVAKLRETRSMHQTLLFFKMAAKGGNYVRTKRLVEQHAIPMKATAQEACLLTRRDFDQLKAMRAEGMSFRGMAKQTGFSRGTIQSALAGDTYQHFHLEDQEGLEPPVFGIAASGVKTHAYRRSGH